MAKFIDIPSDEGMKSVNVEDIAIVEEINGLTIVTLSVKKEKDVNISFNALLPWAYLSANIKSALS